MEALARNVSTPTHEDWMKRRQRLLLFLVLAGLYLAGHLLFRWLFTLLFFDLDNFTVIQEYFGPKLRTPFEIVYQVATSLVPVAVWAAALLLLLRHRWLTHCSLAFLLIMWGMVFLEADMQWYRMSKKHIAWADLIGYF